MARRRSKGGASGDLYIVLNVEPAKWAQDTAATFTELDIPRAGRSGGEAGVETLYGTEIIKIPQALRTGKCLD